MAKEEILELSKGDMIRISGDDADYLGIVITINEKKNTVKAVVKKKQEHKFEEIFACRILQKIDDKRE